MKKNDEKNNQSRQGGDTPVRSFYHSIKQLSDRLFSKSSKEDNVPTPISVEVDGKVITGKFLSKWTGKDGYGEFKAFRIETEDEIVEVQLGPKDGFRASRSAKVGHEHHFSFVTDKETISGRLINRTNGSFTMPILRTSPEDPVTETLIYNNRYIETEKEIVDVYVSNEKGCSKTETHISRTAKIVSICGVGFTEALKNLEEIVTTRAGDCDLELCSTIKRFTETFWQYADPDSFNLWLYFGDKTFTGDKLYCKQPAPEARAASEKGVDEILKMEKPGVMGGWATAFLSLAQIPRGSHFVRLITANSRCDSRLGLFIIYRESPGINYGTNKYFRLGVYENPLSTYDLNNIVERAGNTTAHIGLQGKPYVSDSGTSDLISKEISKIYGRLKR